MIETKQLALAKLEETDTAAREAYFAKHKELRDAQAAVAEAKASAEKLDALIRQKDVVQRSLEASRAQLENKQREVNRAVEPVKPTENDVTIKRGEDRRLLYTLVSGGVILVVFTGLILWTLHTASIEAPAVRLHAADLRPMTIQVTGLANPPAPNPLPASPPAADAKDDDKPDENHEPAVA